MEEHTVQPYGGRTLRGETAGCFMVADTITWHLFQATINPL